MVLGKIFFVTSSTVAASAYHNQKLSFYENLDDTKTKVNCGLDVGESMYKLQTLSRTCLHCMELQVTTNGKVDSDWSTRPPLYISCEVEFWTQPNLAASYIYIYIYTINSFNVWEGLIHKIILSFFFFFCLNMKFDNYYFFFGVKLIITITITINIDL